MRKVLLVCCLTLFAPPLAHAYSEKWEDKALNIAEGYWQKKRAASNCSTDLVTVKRVNKLPGGAWGMSPIGGCEMAEKGDTIARIKVSSEADDWGWKWYCTLLIHEWGHLTGLGHGGGIMHATITSSNLAHSSCSSGARKSGSKGGRDFSLRR